MSDSTDDDDGQSKFYSLIGYSITRWAHAEAAVYHLCRLCLGSSERLAAIVFYRTPSLDGRLQLVSEMIPAALELDDAEAKKNPLVREWLEILKAMNDQKQVRNHLAHQPVTSRMNASISLSDPARNRVESFVSVPQSPQEALRRRASRVEVRAEELEPHYRAVEAATGRLWSLYEALEKALADARAKLPE